MTRRRFFKFPWSEVEQCEICSRFGVPEFYVSKIKKLQSRYDVIAINFRIIKWRYVKVGHEERCNECWNSNCCELCGKYGPPNRVHYRNDIFGWNLPTKNEAPTDWWYGNYVGKQKILNVLCTSCWNKARAISDRFERLEKLNIAAKSARTLLNKRHKENQNGIRNQINN